MDASPRATSVRLRAARSGGRRGLIAFGIIAFALFVVNVVEALIPGLFGLWMRLRMAGIAALMVILALSARHDLRAGATT